MPASSFRITSHYAPSDSENGINIVSHITHLVDSYFIWVGGTAEKPDSLPNMPPVANGGMLSDDELNQPNETLDSRTIKSFVAQVMQGGLVAKDWACAMPSRQVSPKAGPFARDKSTVNFRHLYQYSELLYLDQGILMNR
jgi:hypothetical protein